MRRLGLAVSAASFLLVSGCSSTPAPLPGGPPPEYETPRPFPLATASASASVSEAPKTLPFGSVEELGAHVDAYMAGYGSKSGESYAPSGVLVVAIKGEPVLVRSYGKADRKAGVAASPATRFRIGSLTKQFTAAATLKLIDDGKIKLDDSVQKLCTELPDTYKPVTVKMLLQQTSGVVSYTSDPKLMARKTENVSEADMLAWVAGRPPHFAPGSKWEYSNSNYYLLAIIVERASKQPFETYLTQHVLAPAGMKDASSLASGPSTAVGYMRDSHDAIVPAAVVSTSVPFGAGFLTASANDLLAWDRALVGTSVLSESDKTTMWTPGIGDYAMGWIIAQSKDGSPVTWHNGAIDGFGSFFARAPKQDLAVVFLSNVFDFDASHAGSDVLKMALGGAAVPPPVERPSLPVDDAFAKSLTGDYVLTKESKETLLKALGNPALVDSVEGFTVGYDAGSLTGHPVGQGTFPMRRGSDGVLFSASNHIDLVPDFGGKKPSKTALGFTLKQGGLDMAYVRGKLKPKPADKLAEKNDPNPAEKKPQAPATKPAK